MGATESVAGSNARHCSCSHGGDGLREYPRKAHVDVEAENAAATCSPSPPPRRPNHLAAPCPHGVEVGELLAEPRDGLTLAGMQVSSGVGDSYLSGEVGQAPGGGRGLQCAVLRRRIERLEEERSEKGNDGEDETVGG
jgi:hypothetical protein